MNIVCLVVGLNAVYEFLVVGLHRHALVAVGGVVELPCFLFEGTFRVGIHVWLLTIRVNRDVGRLVRLPVEINLGFFCVAFLTLVLKM
jgi:hypothetical protein